MSFIEKKNMNNVMHAYFTKKTSFMNNQFVIKEYIGKYANTITKETYLLKNIDKITEKEYLFRKPFLEKISPILSHNIELPQMIEKKTIKLDNLIDAKMCDKYIENEFAKEFIFNSNNIEGSKIPKEKIIEIIETGQTKYKNKNEVIEVENSIKAFKYIKEDFNFNLASIKRLYYILTQKMTMESNLKYPRGFKDIPIIAGNQETTNPENVEEELLTLLKWYKENKRIVHPLILAFDFHIRYELIHPFVDANGRTGRLIMNKILMANHYNPIIVFKDNREAYFNAISKAREGKQKKYYQFMLEQTNKSYELMLKRIKEY
jgi:Fic family protein